MTEIRKIFSLEGRVALVTGAAGYLGQSISYALAEAGAKVILCGRNEFKLQELASRMISDGHQVEVLVFDVTNLEETKTSINSIQLNDLDILVNNAYNGGFGSTETSSPQQYLDSFGVSVIGASNLFRETLPYLRSAAKRRGSASVINIASMYGMVAPDLEIYTSKGVANPPYYGAAKAALIQWTKYIAAEFGIEGIRANTISPGPFPSVETQFNNPLFVEKLSSKVPLGRVGKSDEIKGAIIYLSSSASSFVTGSNLVIDGGWIAL